jgi:hypothetical protein
MLWVRYILSELFDGICLWASGNNIADYMPLSPEDDHDTTVDIIYPLEHPVSKFFTILYNCRYLLFATFLFYVKQVVHY